MTREELINEIGQMLSDAHAHGNPADFAIADKLIRLGLVTISEPFTPKPGLVCDWRDITYEGKVKPFRKVLVIGEIMVPLGLVDLGQQLGQRWLVQRYEPGNPDFYGALHIVRAEDLEAIEN
jgi:hypothetical protein